MLLIMLLVSVDPRSMDYLLVPNILLEFTRPCKLYLLRVGDVLITLNVNNVVEKSF